jgi:hypothetical protein
MTTTVPKEIPESLTAWAERTALTLTDADWRYEVPKCARPGLSPWPLDGRWTPAQARALLAVLDRIAGELTTRELAAIATWGATAVPSRLAPTPQMQRAVLASTEGRR